MKRPSAGWIVAIILGALLLGGTSYAAGVQLVRNVDEPGRHPFHDNTTCSFNSGSTSGGGTSITLPPKKRLVIDYVNIDGTVPTGQKILHADVQTTAAGVIERFDIPVTFAGTQSGIIDEYMASAPTTIYADRGTTVDPVCLRDSTTGTGAVNIAISGHLL